MYSAIKIRFDKIYASCMQKLTFLAFTSVFQSQCQWFSDNHPTTNARTYCNRPASPNHGFVHSIPVFKSRFFSGDFVTFTCKPGFVLDGPHKVQCLNKVWESRPQCICKYYFNNTFNRKKRSILFNILLKILI